MFNFQVFFWAFVAVLIVMLVKKKYKAVVIMLLLAALFSGYTLFSFGEYMRHANF